MDVVSTTLGLAAVIIVITLILIWWLVRTSRSEAVASHTVKEAQANAAATRKASGELVRHVDRGDTVRSLRDGVF
ncbi:hypothetical protein [Rhizobium sp. 18065]|uniref:hypothetical protein n=1 Tax=Rhizobium sp. 18065 TaxID=2681411 RepID=UPI00135C6142|nr:hypothetical protein [Rhizobium sp. 18065]